MPLDRKKDQAALKHVFGPVSSKRLGQSLGVDLVPMKSCTWNCVYCQLGRTMRYTTLRREFYPHGEILSEIRQSLRSGAHIDWITFVRFCPPRTQDRKRSMKRSIVPLRDFPSGSTSTVLCGSAKSTGESSGSRSCCLVASTTPMKP